MSKRLRLIITSVVLSLGFVAIQFVDSNIKTWVIAVLVLLSGIFSFWSLREGLGKNMTLLSLILPMLFTLGVGFFWFLLPVNIYTQIPIVIFYAIGTYVLNLTMNIYTVSATRTIALLRAAHGVGFVLTLLTSFLLFDALFSIKQNVVFTSLLVFIASFLLFFQGFWSIKLDIKFDKEVFVQSLISSLIMAEATTFIYFWPVTVVVGSLFLTSGVYLLLGLGQAKLEERLFSATVRDYITVGIIVLLGMFFATRWGG